MFEYRVISTVTIIIKLADAEATPLKIFSFTEETKWSVSVFSNPLSD